MGSKWRARPCKFEWPSVLPAAPSLSEGNSRQLPLSKGHRLSFPSPLPQLQTSAPGLPASPERAPTWSEGEDECSPTPSNHLAPELLCFHGCLLPSVLDRLQLPSPHGGNRPRPCSGGDSLLSDAQQAPPDFISLSPPCLSPSASSRSEGRLVTRARGGSSGARHLVSDFIAKPSLLWFGQAPLKLPGNLLEARLKLPASSLSPRGQQESSDERVTEPNHHSLPLFHFSSLCTTTSPSFSRARLLRAPPKQAPQRASQQAPDPAVSRTPQNEPSMSSFGQTAISQALPSVAPELRATSHFPLFLCHQTQARSQADLFKPGFPCSGRSSSS